MIDLKREEMIGMLQEAVCEVEFTKKDGTIRKMNASLLTESVNRHPPKGTSTKPVNEEVIPVIDEDADGWRSFRVDSIISFKKKG